MYRSLRNKLVLLYTISTGLILIIVMIIILIVAEKELKEKRLEAFINHGSTISNKLKFDNTVKHSWLSQLESKNNLLIQIEDNGSPISFRGVLPSSSDRDLLMKQLIDLALEEGIDTGKNPIFFNEAKSSIYTIKGEKNEIYFGLAVIIPTATGWRSLLLLQYFPNYYSLIINQRILYSLLGLAGIISLFLVSLCFVSKMLRPIEESNRKQTTFIAAASHELRSPLSVILANNTAISTTTAQDQIFHKGIDKECKRMAHLIDDMLLLTCMDAKTWLIHKEPIEIDTLLVETYEAFLPLFKQNDLSLVLKLQEDELPIIYGDKDRLKQILAILLDNALSYSPPRKKVFLNGFVSNCYLNIELEDQGIGITDTDKKLIFDRFYRADKSRNDKKHFGLGLCIANELVQRHGGKISIRDTEGGGATFVIRIRV
jgi:OmpR-family two-component system manganese-sensing sensor histidine kinase